MKIITGSAEVPVIYTAHHASSDFGEFSGRVALNDEQRVRFSDYGTAETVPQNGTTTIIAERSRALGDLNRDPDDPGRFQDHDYHQPDRHPIWLPGHELTIAEKQHCQEMFYQPFHDEIVKQLVGRDTPTLVVAWDNTAHYKIGNNEAGDSVIMPPFVLSNRGAENSAEPGQSDVVSCDPGLLTLLARNFAAELEQHDLPSEIFLNLVFKGGYICQRYSTLRNEAALRALGVTCDVQSFQLEYDTAITHDQATLEPRPDKMSALCMAFSAAIAQTLRALEN